MGDAFEPGEIELSTSIEHAFLGHPTGSEATFHALRVARAATGQTLSVYTTIITGARRVGELLSACASLKILITSRELLHLSGEHVFKLNAGPGANLRAGIFLDGLSQEADNLFVARREKSR